MNVSEAAIEKFNMDTIAVPDAFLGKDRDKKYGSENFRTGNGKRGTGSKIMQLALMHTYEVMLGKNVNELKYSAFTEALRVSRPTISKNLKALVVENTVTRSGQSGYGISVDYAPERSKTVYGFLLTEEIDCGGKVRRLTPDEALYVSIIAMHQLKQDEGEAEENEEGAEESVDKYFVGGRRRAAKTLNIPLSTAGDLLHRLVEETKALNRNVMYKDSAGNKIVKAGKGTSSKEVTVYTVNKDILARCRKIEARKAAMRKVKETFGQNAQKPKRAAKSKRGGNYDKYAFAENTETAPDFGKVLAAFGNDDTVINLKQRYKRLYSAFLDTLRSGDEREIDNIEQDMDDVQEELREYLIRAGAPPNAISDNLTEYIKD